MIPGIPGITSLKFPFPVPGSQNAFPAHPWFNQHFMIFTQLAQSPVPSGHSCLQNPPTQVFARFRLAVWCLVSLWGPLSSAAPQSKHCESLLKQRRKIFSLIFDKFKQPGKRARISLLRPSGASEVWESPGAPSSPRTLPLVYNPPLRKGLRLPIIDCILSTICKFINCVDVEKNICEEIKFKPCRIFVSARSYLVW